MSLADFTIQIHSEIPRAVRVVVYDSVKGLRIASAQFDNRTRSKRQQKSGRFSDVLGICHRFELYDRNDVLQPVCAIVRLAKPNLGVGIISHELAHAAVWVHELNHGEGTLKANDDETFAWTLGELVRQTVNVMNKYKIFDEE